MNYTRYKMLPKPQGPYSTGCIDFMHGRSRQGSLLRIYYPSNNDQDNKKLMPWFPGYEYTKGLSKFLSTSIPYVIESSFNWYTRDTKIQSVVDAPVAEDKFPLILFSHGLAAHRAMYSTVCNDLASHGFIVAAIEHRDESACATFTLSDSGEKIYIHYKPPPKNEKQYPLRHEQVEIRAKECIEALNVMELLAEGKIDTNELPCTLPLKSFEGKIDTSRPILAGHSFGGATAILALSKEKRFKLGLSLDPWMFPIKEDLKRLAAEVTQPLLLILTEGFLHEVNVKSYLPFNLDRNAFVTLKGTVHHNQSDTPFLFGFVGRAFTGCWSSTDRYLAITLNNRLMLNFICKHLGLPINSWKGDVRMAQKFMLDWNSEPVSFECAQELLNCQTNNNVISHKHTGHVSHNQKCHKPVAKL